MASRDEIAAAWPALAPLQPVRLVARGLVCAPRAAAEPAIDLAACPLPVEPLPDVPGWPRPPSDWVAGWYRRGPEHVAAPAGVREIVLCPGAAFGADGHSTSALALSGIDGLPDGAAVDAGCGAGILSLAWAMLRKGPVRAIDVDAEAVRQTRMSVAAAGLEQVVDVARVPLESVDGLCEGVLLANVPPGAHRVILSRLERAPRAALVAGVRAGAGEDIVDGYRRLGMETASHKTLDGWERWTLLRHP